MKHEMFQVGIAIYVVVVSLVLVGYFAVSVDEIDMNILGYYLGAFVVTFLFGVLVALIVLLISVPKSK